MKGRGVRALLEGKEIMAGGPALLESMKIKIPEALSNCGRRAGV